MSPQMYLVEFVVERLRKTPPRNVYRWVVIANSDQEAIDSLRSETAHKTKGEWSATMIGQSMSLPTQRGNMSNTIDFMLSAFVLSSELWGCCFSVPKVESEPRPRYVPPPFPPQLAPPPPPTPEQIKAQEKRARKAAKWAKLNQADLDPRAVAKLVNSSYPGGLGCPKLP